MTTYRRKLVRYSLTIKRQVIRRIENGELSVGAAAREYGIGGAMTIYRWLDRRDIIMNEEQGSSPSKSESTQSSEELAAEIEMLRQLLAQERLRSEAYLTMIKLAEEQFKIPIEKKSGAKPSSK